MAWLILVLSGVFETVWAVALAASDGLRRPGPVAVFLIGTVASLAGLAYAMRTVPTGTAYAVWVGVGAALTVVWSTVTGQERPTTARLALLLLLVAGVVGLKVVG